MRTKLWLGVILSTSALAACGGGGDDPDAPVNPNIDSPTGTADASPDGRPDADPLAPDAAPAWACNGQPNPTTAAATINVGGTTVEIATSGSTPVPNTTVDLFLAGGSTPVASTTSAGGTADWVINDLPTGGVALDGYVRGTFPGTGRKFVYVYPPQPLFQSVDNVVVTTASDTTLELINLVFLDPDHDPNNGAVGVLVTDCLGNPLEGATVSAAGATGPVLYRNAAGNPDATATSTGPDGIGIVFNVPPGNAVLVDATYQGYDMRQHTITVRRTGAPDNAISTTIVIP
jgi:hypothetical protein